MFSKLKENPSVTRLIARYDHLPRRDQQALKLMVVALLLALVYFAVWRPVATYHDQAVSARDHASELLAWMQQNREVIRGLGGGSASEVSASDKPQSSRELMETVTGTAREAGLDLQRFEPSGDSAIRVWLENVPFSEVAQWLEGLSSNHGILIEQAAMDRRDSPGVVSVRLTLAI
ncbi:type II secretion system protein GspM [Marinobacter sp.]|uniref:type II secretion system protein GspM n=1 Tax=Marinobacter sp. TaxID=50741 RepID=UPI003562E565